MRRRRKRYHKRKNNNISISILKSHFYNLKRIGEDRAQMV